ncbi:hypothetical protein KCV07_g379, partial [Aureobasidium melanogenum]
MSSPTNSEGSGVLQDNILADERTLARYTTTWLPTANVPKSSRLNCATMVLDEVAGLLQSTIPLRTLIVAHSRDGCFVEGIEISMSFERTWERA